LRFATSGAIASAAVTPRYSMGARYGIPAVESAPVVIVLATTRDGSSARPTPGTSVAIPQRIGLVSPQPAGSSDA